MSEENLSAVVGRLISDAQNTDNAEKREKLFDVFMGEPYGDEVKGRSKFVSTDAADAVGAIEADIMDVFTSAENVVEFAPVGPEDEDASKQETQVVSHVFWQMNNGFSILNTWVKEAMMQQNSYVKYGWEEKRRTEIEEYSNLTPEELQQVLGEIQAQAQQGAEYQVLKREGFDITPEGMIAQTGEISLKLRCVKTEKKYVIRCIPTEEFFHTPRWPHVSLDGIPCCGHKREMEWGELLAMGFDEKSLEAGQSDVDDETTSSRHSTRDVFEGEGDAFTGPLRKVTVYEAYVRADMDDDGQAELLKVWAIGDGSTLLKWANGEDAIEEVGHIPFACITPEIIPHRHIGRSIVEKVDDIQQVKTVLIRQTLDNVYLTNYPRPEYDPDTCGEDIANDLAAPAPGAPIRNTGNPINWSQPAPVYAATLPLLEGMDALKETRTGATRYNQGLDGESLNKTASGVAMIRSDGQKRTMLIARTMAETGMMDLFRGIHRDLRNGPLRELVIKLRGQYVAVNPRTWKHRTDMTVNVGMGSGNRDTIRQGLMLIAQAQKEAMAAGLPMVQPKQLHNTLERLVETFGFNSAEPFFIDPDQIPPQPQQPDPRQQIAQAQMQMEQERIAQERAKIQMQGQELQAKHMREMQKLGIDAGQLQLNQQKAVMEDDFKRDKLEIDAATGLWRDMTKNVQSAPPVSYGQVTNG